MFAAWAAHAPVSGVFFSLWCSVFAGALLFSSAGSFVAPLTFPAARARKDLSVVVDPREKSGTSPRVAIVIAVGCVLVALCLSQIA